MLCARYGLSSAVRACYDQARWQDARSPRPYVNTLDNEADLFTKPLIPRLFYPLRDALMNVPISDSEILAMGGRGNTGGRVPQGVVARSA